MGVTRKREPREAKLVCVAPGHFRALTEEDEHLMAVRVGRVITVPWRRPRNYENLKRYFALLNVGFEAFDPEPFTVAGDRVQPRKDFEAFRKWCAIQAGYYRVIGQPGGSVELVAESISFASMDEATFRRLFSDTIDLLLAKVCPSTWTEADVYQQLSIAERRILEFAA